MERRNEELREWLQLIGYPGQLTNEDLDKLNKPSMRSVWRHLQAHVKPSPSVQTIRKNLLLAKLKKMDNIPNQMRESQIESIHDLQQAQNISDSLQKIDSVKGKVKKVDEEIEKVNHHVVKTVWEKTVLKREIEECKDKMTIIELKTSQTEEETCRLSKELNVALCFKLPKTPVSSEISLIKSISNELYSKFSYLEMDVEGISNTVAQLLHYPANVIFESICNVSSRATKELYHAAIKLDIQAEYKKQVSGVLEAKGVQPLNINLQQLYSQIVKNELDLKKSSDSLKTMSEKLEEEKDELKNVLIQLTDKAEQILETLMDISEKKEDETTKKLCKLLKEEIKCAGNVSDDMIVKNESKFRKNVIEINKIMREITKIDIEPSKTEFLNEAKNKASIFLHKLDCHSDNLELFDTYQRLMKDELEMFVKTDLNVLIRNWENSFSSNLKFNEILLCNLLYHPEAKNILKKILEKIVLLQKF